MSGYDTKPETTQGTGSGTPALGGDTAAVRGQLRGVGYEEGAAALKPKGSGAGTPPVEAKGDGAAAEAEEARKAKALAGYQQALGSLLGTKLYEVLHKEISPAKLLGYGEKALDGLLDATVSQAGSLSEKGGLDTDETAAVSALAKVLGEIAKEQANELLKSPEGQKVLVAIRDYVEDHPWQVIAAAVVAAAGAVAANVDIPKISQKVKLTDGLTADVTAKLGKIRDITLAALDVGLTYERGKLKLRGEVNHSEKDGTKGTLSAAYGDDKGKITAKGTLDADGNLVVGLNETLIRDALRLEMGQDWSTEKGLGGNAKIRWADGDFSHEGEADYHGETLKLRLSSEVKDGLMTWYGRGGSTMGPDGDTHTIGGGGRYEGERSKVDGHADYTLGGGLALGLKGEHKASDRLSLYGEGSHTIGGGGDTTLRAGGKYASGDLTAMLDAGLKGGEWTARGEAKQKWGNLEAGANTEVRLSDARLLSVGAHFGYSDPDQFRSFLVDYKRTNAADVPTDVFSARLETRLSEIYLRVQNQTTLEGGHMKESTTQAHAAYFVRPDLALIGGGSYTAGDNPQHRSLIQAGVQIRDVPVLIGFDPQTKGVTIGLTIPFGKGR